MKTPRQFRPNYLFSLVRTASAVTLMSAAAAMAFVAVRPPDPLLLAKAENKGGIDKLRQNHAELFRSKMMVPGPEREGGPTSAADEDYARRAYPAAYVPFELTR